MGEVYNRRIKKKQEVLLPACFFSIQAYLPESLSLYTYLLRFRFLKKVGISSVSSSCFGFCC